MQDPYAETFQRRKFFVDQDPTRICNTSCQIACRRFIEGHSDFFATQPTPRTRCKTRSSPHIPTSTSSRAGHRCPLD